MMRERRRSRECRKRGAVSSKEASDVCVRESLTKKLLNAFNAFLILEIVVVLVVVYDFFFFFYVNLVACIYGGVYILPNIFKT